MTTRDEPGTDTPIERPRFTCELWQEFARWAFHQSAEHILAIMETGNQPPPRSQDDA